MKELNFAELQEINGGGFKEGREIGNALGKGILGGFTIVGIIMLFL